MNEETPHIPDVPPTKRERPITYPPHTPEGVGTLTPAKTKRAKRKAASSKPRVIDPGIAALRAEHNTKVEEYRKAHSSKALLKTILEKRLSQLTTADREKLFDALKLNTTPALPVIQSGGQVAPADT